MRRSSIALYGILFFVIVVSSVSSSCSRRLAPGSFTFAFITDIHLQQEAGAVQGLNKAIDTINYLNPDFVIAGGDQIMGARGQRYGRADSLYRLYQETAGALKMPVYTTLGNHEKYALSAGTVLTGTILNMGKKCMKRDSGLHITASVIKGGNL